jgi:glycosyltransferase involved in cell wall biosynthesis
MIVKNEESCLERCLKSLVPVADEIIVVDTGSSDRTKEIAGRFTDRIYDFAWTGSFSDARNYSFSLAECDYIYCADADEELDEENIKKFIQLKSTLLPEIEIVQMYYCNQLENNTIYNFDRELRPKLYKRIRSFIWNEPIHEQVLLNPVIYDSEIEIIHRPASVHAGRDLARFEKMINDGETISKRLLDIYVKELYIAGGENNYAAASEYFEKMCDLPDLDEDDLLCALTIALKASIIAKDINRQFKYALRGAATKGCSELCCELGNVFYEQGEYSEAAMWYYNAAFETEPLINIRSKKEIPLNAIINCYELMGDKDRADEFRAYL